VKLSTKVGGDMAHQAHPPLEPQLLTPACLRTLQRYVFDKRSSSILHICTLAIEKKCSKPRLWDEVWNKDISRPKANEFWSCISDKIWLKSLAYLAEIFEKLGNLNLKLQGKGTNIIELRNKSASILFEAAKLAA